MYHVEGHDRVQHTANLCMQEQRFLEAYQGRAVLQRRMHAPQGCQIVWHRKLFPFTALAKGPLYRLQPGLRGDGLQRHGLHQGPVVSATLELGCTNCNDKLCSRPETADTSLYTLTYHPPRHSSTVSVKLSLYVSQHSSLHLHGVSRSCLPCHSSRQRAAHPGT